MVQFYPIEDLIFCFLGGMLFLRLIDLLYSIRKIFKKQKSSILPT